MVIDERRRGPCLVVAGRLFLLAPRTSFFSHESGQSVFRNCLARFGHDPLVVRKVVDGNEHRAKHLIRLKQVAQIAPAVTASKAWASCVERLAVMRELLI